MAENKPDATAAVAQSQSVAEEASATATADATEFNAKGSNFRVSDEIAEAHKTRPYERIAGDPLYRPLRIFTLDPSTSRLDGAIATLKVPYERLTPGPCGALFKIDGNDPLQRNEPIDLDDPFILMHSGLDPTPSDPRFHQQMVYAVASSVYAAFRTALGRHVSWSFPSDPDETRRILTLCPLSESGTQNAFYDKSSGSIRFGYFRAERVVSGRNLPGSWVFTSLSHDIVAHEVTHALLDGLRANFTLSTNPDVPAFHEAFADLVAVFQHFSYRAVVERAIEGARGQLEAATLLTGIAVQFSQSRGQESALRSAVLRRHDKEPLLVYGQTTEPHQLGSILVSAVFMAFTTVYSRKVRRYILLATNGTGRLPEGELPSTLVAVLAEEAAGLASQFLAICIRAVDYCPPVDLVFGEYLRAMITADYALVPDDPWAYREALVDAFRFHGIYPPDVPNLSEDALLWRAADLDLPPCPGLSFAELQFRGDPSLPADASESRRQADALGAFVTSRGRHSAFGLVSREEASQEGLVIDEPCVRSIRTTRRSGPLGQVVFDIVAEVTQSRTVVTASGRTFQFHGGATILLDPDARIRYVILKNVRSETRARQQENFLTSANGAAMWVDDGRTIMPRSNFFMTLHEAVQRSI